MQAYHPEHRGRARPLRFLLCAIRRCMDWSGTIQQWAVYRLRQKVIAATLTAVIATMMIVGSGFANIDAAHASPTCSGPMTADGLACCAPGSTPTADDACQLPGGGLAASCPLSQLSSSGTSCCPLSSSPQSDGTCQPASGFASAPGCPLDQLDKGGLSCCPTGQMPQADGSCTTSMAQQQPTTSVSPCPPGLAVYGQNAGNPYTICTGPPTGCPAGTETEIPGSAVFGCCPAGSQSTAQVGSTNVCVGSSVNANGVVIQSAYPPIAPSCPPGSTLTTYSVEFVCAAPPTCPRGYDFSTTTGLCAVGKIFNLPPGVNIVLPTPAPPPGPGPGPAPPPPAPLTTAGCAAGSTLTDGTCFHGPKACPPGQVHGPNGACVCMADETTNPDGTCTCLPSLVSGPNGTCAPRCQTASSATSPGEVFGPNGICVRCPAGSAPDWITDASCLPWCPSDSVINNAGACVPPPPALCPGGVRDVNGTCCEPSQLTNSRVCCPSGEQPQSDGTCSCPVGEIVGLDGYCTVRSSKQCPTGEFEAPDGNCIGTQELRPPPPRQGDMSTGVPLQQGCANGYVLGADNSCHRVTGPACPSGQTMVDGKCACPAGHIAKANGACVCPPRGGPCEAGQMQGPDCNCVAAPTTTTCGSGEALVNSQCQCLPGEIADPQKGGCIPGLATSPIPPFTPGTPAPPITPGRPAPTSPGTRLNPTCTVRGEVIENGHCQCPSGEAPRDGSCMTAAPPAGSKTLTPQKILTLPPKRIVTPPPPPRIARPTTPTFKLPLGSQYKQER
jgi:hypothetical protein